MIDRRCRTADEVAAWVQEVSRFYGQSGPCEPCGQKSKKGISSTASTTSMLSTKIYPELSANAALVLLTVACSLLDRQVDRLAKDFENEGGFTERLYRVRSDKRRNKR